MVVTSILSQPLLQNVLFSLYCNQVWLSLYEGGRNVQFLSINLSSFRRSRDFVLVMASRAREMDSAGRPFNIYLLPVCNRRLKYVYNTRQRLSLKGLSKRKTFCIFENLLRNKELLKTVKGSGPNGSGLGQMVFFRPIVTAHAWEH